GAGFRRSSIPRRGKRTTRAGGGRHGVRWRRRSTRRSGSSTSCSAARCRRSTRSPDQYPPPPIVVHIPLRQIPPAVWQRSTSPPVETGGAGVEGGSAAEVGLGEVVGAPRAGARRR